MSEIQEPTIHPAASSHREWGAVLSALLFPTAFTWLYFVALADSPPSLQQGAFLIGKIVQFGFPAVWVFVVCRERLVRSERPAAGIGVSVGFGLLIMGVTLVLYHVWLRPSGMIDVAAEAVRNRVASAGINSTAKYVLLAVFYSAMHSLMEEYYWRWFVFGRLKNLVRLPIAIVVSSLGFMAHHVIVLSQYFGWGSFLSLFASLSVAVGGAVWAWLYHRHRTLLGPWMSHALVDAAIFLVGYEILKTGTW